jgi:hypothetical protein
MMKITQKFNICPNLSSKKLEHHLQEVLLIKGFLEVQRACPNFIKTFLFDFVEYSITKLLNIK